ncbi:hypothetical protein KUTeg_001501 [Tegillarca granosa]|uniref:Uncharacterized protein n=1 Tax=Tegillarca granosa TaxID=220873 RepID=A0ABQ9FRK6_TEGGR|nr:hypothetical protein KUTeg_001501 [Tegillarca granosa]
MYLFSFIVCLMIGYSQAVIEIVFDPDSSPPATIPTPVDRIYSLALDHVQSLPIIAYLQDGGQTITDFNGYFNVSSVDVDVHNAVPSATDDWIAGGGELCQFANRNPYPIRMEYIYYLYVY